MRAPRAKTASKAGTIRVDDAAGSFAVVAALSMTMK